MLYGGLSNQKEFVYRDRLAFVDAKTVPSATYINQDSRRDLYMSCGGIILSIDRLETSKTQ